MEYIIDVQLDVGDIRVHVQSDIILNNQDEVLSLALKKIGESTNIILKDSTLAERIYFDIVEGKTLEDM